MSYGIEWNFNLKDLSMNEVRNEYLNVRDNEYNA
jgi:hypothetical protein